MRRAMGTKMAPKRREQREIGMQVEPGVSVASGGAVAEAAAGAWWAEDIMGEEQLRVQVWWAGVVALLLEGGVAAVRPGEEDPLGAEVLPPGNMAEGAIKPEAS